MAVSAVVGLVTAVGASIAVPLVLGAAYSITAFGFAAAFALGAGVSAISKALVPKVDIGAAMRGTTVTTRDAAAPRKIIYGKVRVGGNVVFIAHSGTDNKYLHIAVVFATHYITAYDEVWFNDNKIWTASGGFQGDWGTYVTMDTTKLGTAAQSASSLLTPISQWTSDHKLSGIAYLAFKLEWNQDKFPQGVPNITAVIRGKRVFDPRTNVTGYSTNPALCVRDYLLDSTYGLGEINANIDSDALEAAADLCDESVAINGGTQTRYECNGVIDTSNQIKANIENLLSAMGGRIAYSNGKYFIQGAEYVAPTFSFDESNTISAITIQTKQSRRQLYNGVKGSFISEEKNYKLLDYPAQILKTTAGNFVIGTTYKILFVGTTDFTAIGASSSAVGVEFTATGAGSGTGTASSSIVDDGAQINLDMPLPFVTNNLQAQRIAKIALLKSRQQVVLSFTVNLSGLKVKVGDTVNITNERLGYSDKVFEVIDYELIITGSGESAVKLTLIETAAAVYDWTTSDEVDFLAGGELDLYDGRTVDNVTSLAFTEIGFQGPDGQVLSAVELTWTEPDDAFIEFYKIRYNKNGTTDYLYAESREPRVYISGLDITSNYDFRVQAQNLLGVSSTGTTLTNQALNGDTTAPSAPSGGAATGGVQTITAEWDNPSDIDFKHTEVFVNTTDSIPASPTAVVDGEEYIVTGLSGAQTRYFWLKAVDFSGNKSAATASFNGTSVEVSATDIGDNAIGSDQIADDAVGSDQIANDAVGSDQIADDAVGSDQISDGAVDIAAFASGIQPVQVVSTLPSTANQGDMAFLTTDNNLYRYNGTDWTKAITLTEVTDSGALAALEDIDLSYVTDAGALAALGTVGSDQIDDDAITNAKIAVDAIQGDVIAAGAITSTMIGEDAVTTAAIANDAITNDLIAANAITETEISDDSITTVKIAANAITATEIAAGAVTATEIAANTITAGQIAAGAVSATEIAANTITSAQIAANTVTASEIAANAITATEIAAGAVTATEIAADTITANEIATGAISTDEIAAGAITTATIAAGAVTADEIAANTVTAAQIAADTISSNEIATDAVTANEIAAGAVTATEIAANTITAGQIAAGAIGADEISVTNLAAINSDLGTLTAGTIDASSVTVSNIDADNITAGNINADRLSIDGVTLDTNASGQLIIADDGVSDDQVLSLDGSQTTISNLQVANLSGDVSEVFNLSVFVYPYHSVPDGSSNANTFAEFTIPAPDSSLNKYASLNGKVKYVPATSLDDCILVMQFERKSKGISSGTLVGGVVGVVGSGTTGLPYTHYVEISGNHTKEIDAYGGIAQSQTSPSAVSKAKAVEYKSATNRTRIIYSGTLQSTPTYTTGMLYYNADRWISSGSWLDDAAGAQRYAIADIGSISTSLTLPLNQALAKSSAAEDYRVRVYLLGRSSGSLSLSGIDSQIFLMT